MSKLPRAASAAGLAAASVLAASGAFAHHSAAMFNLSQKVVLNGTIRRFDWQNPHTWIVFEASNGHGGVEQYGIEGMSPNYLVRHGWNLHTLNAGDKVELTIYPLKDGDRGGLDISVKWPNGKVMYNFPHGLHRSH